MLLEFQLWVLGVSVSDLNPPPIHWSCGEPGPTTYNHKSFLVLWPQVCYTVTTAATFLVLWPQVRYTVTTTATYLVLWPQVSQPPLHFWCCGWQIKDHGRTQTSHKFSKRLSRNYYIVSMSAFLLPSPHHRLNSYSEGPVNRKNNLIAPLDTKILTRTKK